MVEMPVEDQIDALEDQRWAENVVRKERRISASEGLLAEKRKVLQHRYSMPQRNGKLSSSFKSSVENADESTLPRSTRRLSLPIGKSGFLDRRKSVDASALQEIAKILLAKKAIAVHHQNSIQSLCEETGN